MKYQTKIMSSGCILWKTLLGSAYYGKLTYQVLKYSLGRAACYEPVLFSESCQSSMRLSEGKNHSHILASRSPALADVWGFRRPHSILGLQVG